MSKHILDVPEDIQITPAQAHAAAAEVLSETFQGAIKAAGKLRLIFSEEVTEEQGIGVLDALRNWIDLGRSIYPTVLKFIDDLRGRNFHEINYINGLNIRLAPQNAFVRGTLTERIFYEKSTLDPLTGAEIFENPVVKEVFEYVRDANGFALQRTMHIFWYREDGTIDPVTKTRVKTYNLTERIRETDRRRRNIIDHIKTKVLAYLSLAAGMSQMDAVAAGQSLFGTHQTEINNFLEIGSSAMLISAIGADASHPWLDTPLGPSVTIRLVILGDLQ